MISTTSGALVAATSLFEALIRRLSAVALVVGMAATMVMAVPHRPVVAVTADAGFHKDVYEGIGDRAELRFYDASFPPYVQWVDVLVTSEVDTDGLLIRAERASRADPYYRASIGFTEGSTAPGLGLLAVADGDQITFTYLGATTTATATWVARSLTPDFRQLIFENSDPLAPTVSGAAGSVAAGAQVRVYDSLMASTPIGEASSDNGGRFTVTVPAAAGLDELYVASTDNGYTETTRVSVGRAWVTGTVRLPRGEDTPVPSVLVGWFPNDLPHPCAGRANCVVASALTNREGRFSVSHDYQTEDPDFGDGPYATEFHHQGVPASRWTPMGYGNPGSVVATSSGRDVTIDIGTVRLTSPDFTMTAVDSTGAPVVEAAVDVMQASEFRRGAYTQAPDGQAGIAFGSTGVVELGPGTYQLQFQSPVGCLPTQADPVTITWDGATATPAQATVVFRRPDATGAVAEGTSTVPVDAGTTSTSIQTAAGEVTVAFTKLTEDAYLTAACHEMPPDAPPTLDLLDAPVDLDIAALDGGTDVAFSSAEVCLPIDAGIVADADASADDLVIAHVDDLGQVEPLRVSMVDLDIGTICATTSSFSSFAVAVDHGSGNSTATKTYAAEIVDPGGTLATAGTEPLASNPLVTAVSAPGGGKVEITESTVATTRTDRLLLLSEVASIAAPVHHPASPLTLTFDLDTSVIPVSAGRIVPLRNGVPIEDECAPGTGAHPDPCVASYVRDGDGDVTLTVRTSQASIWRFGVERVVRRDGPDRYTTAVELVSSAFPSADRVFLASGEGFADALTASVAAGSQRAAVLLTGKDELPDAVRRELARLNPSDVVIVGGNASVGPGVEAELAEIVHVVTRVAGPDRYATAAAVARRFFPAAASDVWLASGEKFPDALAGSLPAIRTNGPLLLVHPQSVPEATGTELARLAPERLHVLGGPASISESVVAGLPGQVVRLDGIDRYHTAVEISSATLGDGADTLFVATGATFPDALAGSAVAGLAPRHTGLLLVTRDGIPDAVLDEVRRLRPHRVVLLGGPHSISDAVMAELMAELQ